ncbi:conserved domain protein [Bacteroides fluxus YIT 12057]|uniref:Conserved domain protein n=1 Tax=Bacteroides fluxus YIT 12057 TaxID=763034 RepID=F3PTA3_9BACE|nr:conserved domain protein [Bacteroides fluxus YIT 12057]
MNVNGGFFYIFFFLHFPTDNHLETFAAATLPVTPIMKVLTQEILSTESNLLNSFYLPCNRHSIIFCFQMEAVTGIFCTFAPQ